MSYGEVVQCKHCKGTGTCNCSACRVYGDPGPCQSCGGAGAVWVGPKVINITGSS